MCVYYGLIWLGCGHGWPYGALNCEPVHHMWFSDVIHPDVTLHGWLGAKCHELKKNKNQYNKYNTIIEHVITPVPTVDNIHIQIYMYRVCIHNRRKRYIHTDRVGQSTS